MPTRLSTLLLALALAPVTHAQDAAGDIHLTAPLNGWRASTAANAHYTQEVHYPAVAVATPEGQNAGALIAGRVNHHPKAGAPGTLIVNGIALPQRIDADGAFSRPYAFARGANNVEMRAGAARRRVQFYEAGRTGADARLRVILAWDTDGTDLDLHVIAPDGQHTYYGNRVVPDGGALDVDVTTGYGPEIYANATPPPGQYLVYVNYYGSWSRYYGADDAGDDDADTTHRDPKALTIATLSVIQNENTPDEKRQSFVVPMRKDGELTLVARFSVP